MPWRLILFIIIFIVFLVFITFNLDNRCDLSFGVVKFEQVPVFLSVFVSFVLGLICSLPFILLTKRKKGEKSKKDKIQELDAASPRNNESIAEKRERFMNGHGGGNAKK